ncbi:uncharacterized protein B0I36DRAFT_323104 [Microdochium trichocladiopsis]|uniref:Uncharacterized protein n=1 Tax=Microdochium trichocladiopsis TaxID=1682393 RepID=A0A9P8Y6I0_9PEZI|nr:uncharacterized protein B0I36DRAFT_323104 [Microdochium trichocladiopsis]KAH7031060.1 hypothetical protein B0I36DRAFT_323104 [Microdochium trichocladiopsis]
MDRFWLPRVGGNSLLSYGSAAVVSIAALLKLQEHATNYFGSETHCFKSVRTNWDDLPTANCFTVSPKGIITNVYAVDDSKIGSGSERLSEGYAIPGFWDGHGHLLQDDEDPTVRLKRAAAYEEEVEAILKPLRRKPFHKINASELSADAVALKVEECIGLRQGPDV